MRKELIRPPTPSKNIGQIRVTTSKAPFFNILVPTKNRADTLRFCLQSLLAQNYPGFSIVVSDNFSTDDTEQVVKFFGDSRLRYVRTEKPLSMRENWEFALTHIKDGWVTFIGDDDGLIPGALERVAEVINTTGVSAVTSSWCRYTWPGPLAHANKLVLPLSNGLEIRDSRRWRQRVLSGAWRYIELPYVYTGGFVEYRVIRGALSKKNTFFNSIIPDVYSAVAISLLVDRYAYLHEPIAVRGTSSHSTGASSFNSSTNEAPKQEFMIQNAAAMHPLLQDQRFPMSTHLFVYECYLQAAFLEGQSTIRLAASDLGRQLRIVKALSARRDRQEVSVYCNRILDRTGKRPFGFSLRWLWLILVKPLYFLIEANRVLSSALIDTAPMGVNDVYAAGTLARAVLRQERNRPFRRMRRVLRTTRVYARAFRSNPG